MRRLIVCSDGTWNTPDHMDRGVLAPTNVVKMARAVPPQAPDETTQIVFYDPGVGTASLTDKLTGGAFGVGLFENVRDAYLFLVHNYADGDDIYFFGFSRGAYTVRSTAGLIRKTGLLRKEHADRAQEAYKIYRDREGGADSPAATDFRARFSRYPVPIKLIGVWDTVGALGIPGVLNFIGRKRFQFHDVALSRSVQFAYQALAIDEKRKAFEPTIWEQHPDATDQVMEQAWFTGVHMDVGGGYGDHQVPDVAFLWMAEKVRAVGLALDRAYLDSVASPDPLAELHESRAFPYTLIPAYYRPIGEGVPPALAAYPGSQSNESLHPSVRQRWDAAASYRPRNLVDYLRKHP